eukprot:CAMPEP_0179466156 /NCGR_PEP_ID=MMETSP0799-20121207/47544_1 /TAXON_ID=46947 /ORGANISM="Geminigera cryophila, Strain CCMP2564" /LENGTH=65 /DNA_ID=CAMNT_0021270801 /DNA_START=304 /DNA_END=501 /DNA_ORIENTATION=-
MPCAAMMTSPLPPAAAGAAHSGCATKWRCIESAAKLGAGMATAATATARPFSTMRTSSLPSASAI